MDLEKSIRGLRVTGEPFRTRVNSSNSPPAMGIASTQAVSLFISFLRQPMPSNDAVFKYQMQQLRVLYH